MIPEKSVKIDARDSRIRSGTTVAQCGPIVRPVLPEAHWGKVGARRQAGKPKMGSPDGVRDRARTARSAGKGGNPPLAWHPGRDSRGWSRGLESAGRDGMPRPDATTDKCPSRATPVPQPDTGSDRRASTPQSRRSPPLGPRILLPSVHYRQTHTNVFGHSRSR